MSARVRILAGRKSTPAVRRGCALKIFAAFSPLYRGIKDFRGFFAANSLLFRRLKLAAAFSPFSRQNQAAAGEAAAFMPGTIRVAKIADTECWVKERAIC